MKLVFETKKHPISVALSLKELVVALTGASINLDIVDPKKEYTYHLAFSIDDVEVRGDLVWITPCEEDREDTFESLA